MTIKQWIDDRLGLFSFFKEHFSNYPAPKNLNIWYCLGGIALFVLFNQIVSGIFLLMYYTPTAKEAFNSVEFIMRDVRFGWLIRYLHGVGASAFFVLIYLHIYRGILYGSYQRPRELVWVIGSMLFLALIAEAYTGYVLPWGQMSFWASNVIISLLGVIPFIGKTLMIWVQGDYYISGATLHRFFSFHVVAFILLLLILIFVHIVSFHKVGSNNPEGIDINKNKNKDGWPIDAIPYHPYYTIKDIAYFALFLIIFMLVVFYAPDFYGLIFEHENFIPANPLVTPLHIKPAWYLAPFYAILRSIPDKTLGALAMFSAILCLAFLPWLDRSPVRSIRYKGILSRVMLFSFTGAYIFLGYLGMKPATGGYLILSRLMTVIYFVFFLGMPVYSKYERCRPVPKFIPS